MHYDVIISGGGMTGMTLAVSLRNAGFSILIIEKSDTVHTDERTTALNYNTKMFFEQNKIWPHLNTEAQPISEIFTIEGNSTSYLHYNYKHSGNHPMGYIVKNKTIKQALESFNINKLAPITYTCIEDKNDIIEITLTNKTKLTTDLFVCAEGKHSRIYDLLNIQRLNKEYKQSCIVCNVEHLENHQGSAQERFYPTGPFALLPIKGDFFSSLIWTANPSMANHLSNLTHSKFIEEINKHCNFHITKIISDIQVYPISLSLARRYYKNRILLIGDAMESIHPVAGQGFNLIVKNIDCLIQQLIQHGINRNALRAFTKKRVIDNLIMAGTTHSLIKLFSNNNTTLKIARSTGLSVIQELHFLKKKLVTYAMGRS